MLYHQCIGYAINPGLTVPGTVDSKANPVPWSFTQLPPILFVRPYIGYRIEIKGDYKRL